MPRHGRRAAPSGCALVVALLVGLCGCSGPEEKTTVDLDGAGGSASPTASGSPSSDGEEGQALPAGVPSPTPPPRKGQKAATTEATAYALHLPPDPPASLVGQALVDYMAVRSEAYNKVQVDLPKLASLAMGDPLSTVQTRVLELRQQGRHSVGDLWFDVGDDDVQVTGKKATFDQVCLLSGSVDVDDQNVAVEASDSHYLTSGTALRLAPDVWVIDSLSFDTVQDC